MKLANCIIAFLFLLAASTVGINTVKAKTLYDDFPGNYLDSSKWNQSDFVREVSGGKLILKTKSTVANTYERSGAEFQDPSSINSIQCEIIVNAATLDSGTDTESFARIGGFFYNSQAEGGATGDVWAGIHIGNRGSGLEAYWEVSESLNDDLTSWNILGLETIAGLSLDTGNPYTVKLEYDGANTFTFTVAGLSATFDSGPARQRAAVTQSKALAVGAYSNGGSGSGFASASFDDVQTNGAAYDDFSSSRLDQANWQHQELVREIDNGKIRLVSHSTGDRENAGLSFSEIHPYVEATITVNSDSSLASGDRGIARIDGHFYNDTYGPGTYQEHEGNVWVGFYLDYQDGELIAKCSGDRVKDPGDTDWDNLFFREFNLPISFDTAYKMAIHFTGNRLRFIIKDMDTGRMDSFGYDVTTAVNDPYDESMTILSRVYGDADGGYMAVEVDDVYVDVAEPPAIFDASGDWQLTVSDFWRNTGCSLPNASDAEGTFSQTGNDFTLVVDDDETTTLSGKVYGDTYTFFEREDDNGETEIIYGIFTLSDAASGSGNVTIIWFDDEDYCEVGFGLSLTEGSADGGGGSGGGGGGGGCFIEILSQ